MTERPEIDLEPEHFRPRYDRPLADPAKLWKGMAICGVLCCISAVGAWGIGTWWSAFLPIFPAMYLGIGWAGLEPGYWFGKSDGN